MRRLMATLAALVVALALLIPLAPSAGAASGSANGGYPAVLFCVQPAPGLWVLALASSSYGDPFFGGGWLASSTVTGYVSFRGCYPDAKYGDATRTSYSTRLVVFRQVFDGSWVNCGDYTAYSTGTNADHITEAYGALTGYPAVPCQYVNWPAGLTYIGGHWRAQYGPNGLQFNPFYSGVIDFAYIV